MLVPKRVKHRKVQRGSMKGNAKGGTTLNHGSWGIQALDRHWICLLYTSIQAQLN